MAISRNDRAKQFLPFDALKGFKEALKEKEDEIEYVDKKELSEERLNELSEKLNTIEVGNSINIVYYVGNKYKKINGKVKDIDAVNKKIVLYENININFGDILEIEKD